MQGIIEKEEFYETLQAYGISKENQLPNYP